MALSLLVVGMQSTAVRVAAQEVPTTQELGPATTTPTSSTTSLVGGEPVTSVPGAAIDLSSSTTTTGLVEATTSTDVLGTDSSVVETPSSTTTTGTTTTTLAVVARDVADDDAVTEEPPPPFIPVLPPNPNIVRNPTLEKLLYSLTAAQKKIVVEAQTRADVAQANVEAAESRLDDLRRRVAEALDRQGALGRSVDDLRGRVRDRALRTYAGEQVEVLDQLLRSQDVSALARRLELVSQAQRLDADLTDSYRSEQLALTGEIDRLEVLRSQSDAEVVKLRAEQATVGESLAKVQQQLSFVSSGTAIALGGFVFPVAGANSFVDTFGAPRMVGTPYYHLHEGTDVFATQGTPLVATNRGVIAKKGVGVLGGNKLWLVAADGTQYYAHLSAFADGVDDGTIVEAGQVVGYVGTAGNAVTTPAHVHFEIHPGGGAAIDPFPILDAARRSDLGALSAARPTPMTTTTVAGEVRAGVGVESDFAVDPTPPR